MGLFGEVCFEEILLIALQIVGGMLDEIYFTTPNKKDEGDCGH